MENIVCGLMPHHFQLSKKTSHKSSGLSCPWHQLFTYEYPLPHILSTTAFVLLTPPLLFVHPSSPPCPITYNQTRVGYHHHHKKRRRNYPIASLRAVWKFRAFFTLPKQEAKISILFFKNISCNICTGRANSQGFMNRRKCRQMCRRWSRVCCWWTNITLPYFTIWLQGQ